LRARESRPKTARRRRSTWSRSRCTITELEHRPARLARTGAIGGLPPLRRSRCPRWPRARAARTVPVQQRHGRRRSFSRPRGRP
jgi:hypothetical protein